MSMGVAGTVIALVTALGDSLVAILIEAFVRGRVVVTGDGCGPETRGAVNETREKLIKRFLLRRTEGEFSKH